MAEFTYTTVPGKLKQLFTKLREVGVPPKATIQWLKSLGFNSSNDASLLGVLKAVGFVDATGVPTPTWSSFRGATSKKVLGDAIREGYAELFAVYPDAWLRSQTDLEHVFGTSSSGGRQVISKTVSTFKSLAELAEFTPVGAQTELHLSSEPLHVPVSTPESPTIRARDPLGGTGHRFTSISKCTSLRNLLRHRSTRFLQAWQNTSTVYGIVNEQSWPERV